MQLTCMYCRTSFALSRDEMLAALQHMEQHKQKYYDAHCPKCRRANRVEGKRLEVLFPNWKETLQTMKGETAKAEEKPAKAEAGGGSVKAANRVAGQAETARPDSSKAKPAAKSGAKVSGGVKNK